MFGILYEMNCCTQYFIWEKYACFCDILIKLKLHAEMYSQKLHLDVAIQEGDYIFQYHIMNNDKYFIIWNMMENMI